MTTWAVPPAITYCPPRPAHTLLPPEPQFYRWFISPVGKTTFDGERAAHSETGLSYQDVAAGVRVSQRREIGHARRLETPTWAVNDSALRKLLVFYWERRACIRNGSGSDRDRLQAAHAKALGSLPHLAARLDNLCAEFAANADLGRRRILTRQIKALDASIVYLRRGPALQAAIVVYFFRNRMGSVGVADCLHVSSPYVRQQIFRLNRDFDRMAGKIPVRKQTSRPYRCTEKKRAAACANLNLAKIPRAGLRLERAEARLTALKADREAFIEARAAVARRRCEKRIARAQADVDATRERIITLAERCL